MAKTPKTPLAQRIADADELANRWLADGNESSEAGKVDKANRCYAKAQHWKDRYNLLTGAAEKAAPRI